MARENAAEKIMREYEELRTKAAADRKKRIDEVHASFPRVEEIDKEIYRRGFENMTLISKNPEKSEEYNKDFKENLTRLENEKKKIIAENNINPDFDKYKYECEICSDTGYDADGKKCICFKQKLINEAYLSSNMADIIKKQNFDTFSLDYYSKTVADGELSPYENMVKIYNGCRKFCDNFDDEEKGFVFYGTTGLGKTFLSSAVAKEVMDNGKTVVYIRAPKLFRMYEDYKFGRGTEKEDIDNIYGCDLLIIDDLGTEKTSEENISFLLDIINERCSGGKKIIISTNLQINELAKIYSMRLLSRLYEYFILCKFYGEDIRLQKLKG